MQSEREDGEGLHVGIIMDGNGRWATQRGLPRLKGHSRGAETVQEIVEASSELGVKYLTLFAFSTENWKRSEQEVSGLMTLFKRYIKSKAERLIAENVRVRFIGGQDRMDTKLLELMGWLEYETRDNGGLHLNVAMNYGGRDEIVRAVQKLSIKVAQGDIEAHQLTEEMISAYIDTGGMPDPDLIIRTSGEMRISNFLSWQNVYSEFAFVDTLWPDFTAAEFEQVLAQYFGRERRFGTVATG